MAFLIVWLGTLHSVLKNNFEKKKYQDRIFFRPEKSLKNNFTAYWYIGQNKSSIAFKHDKEMQKVLNFVQFLSSFFVFSFFLPPSLPFFPFRSYLAINSRRKRICWKPWELALDRDFIASIIFAALPPRLWETLFSFRSRPFPRV